MLHTYLSDNATLFAKGCCIHFGMVFFVQRDFLQVLFAYLWFLHYYFLQRTYCMNLECTCFKKLLQMLRETPVQRCRVYTFLKQCLHSLQRSFALVCFVAFIYIYIYYSCSFWLNLYMYQCKTWESYWECTVVAFVAEATMFGLERRGFSIFCKN